MPPMYRCLRSVHHAGGLPHLSTIQCQGTMTVVDDVLVCDACGRVAALEPVEAVA